MNVLFEGEEVKKLLKAYQKLIGVRIAVLDSEFKGLYSSQYGISRFCTEIRKNSTINEACIRCDKNAFSKTKEIGETYVYKCHLGLYEAITPIMDGQQILGYIMLGQILSEENKVRRWQHLKIKLSKAGLDSEAYEHYYSELKQMTVEEIDAASQIMKACASAIWLRHIIDVERAPITERIKSYIEAHYTEVITVKTICNDLKVGKTTVYKYLKLEHGVSLTAYVNNYRLEKSKKLLLERDYSIAEVAMAVGIPNYNYYTRLFKEAYGLTPTQYRGNR